MTRRDSPKLPPHAPSVPDGTGGVLAPAEAPASQNPASARGNGAAEGPTGEGTLSAGAGYPLDAPPVPGVTARPRVEGEQLRADLGALDPGAEVSPRALALRALVAAHAPLPHAFPVVWRDGNTGAAEVEVYRVEGRDGSHALEQLRADLGALLSRPWPKGERGARVLYPCESEAHALLPPGAAAWEGPAHEAPRPRLAREDTRRAVFVVLDSDARGGPLRDVWYLLRDAGVAAVAYPSPSAEVPAGGDPLDALHWRALVPVAEGCDRREFTRHVRALDALLRALGCRVDASPLRPESACFVAPRPERGPRPEHHALCLDGAALDLATLDKHAMLAGWRTAADVARDTATEREGIVRPRDAAPVLAALDALGIVGAALSRGLRELHCPRAHWHGSSPRRGARGGSSAVVCEGAGWALCSHDHSAAPEGEQGPANLARVVQWAAEDLRAEGREGEAAELLTRLREMRDDTGALAAVREQLQHAPFGERDRRTVETIALRDELLDVVRQALQRRDGRAVLFTPTVGAGKSTAIAWVCAQLLRAGYLATPAAEDKHTRRASAGVLVRTRKDAEEMVANLARAGVRAALAMPVHTHPAGCRYTERARDIYERGASARAVLCNDIPPDADAAGYGSERGERCEWFAECPARVNPFVPHRLAEDTHRRLPVVREGVEGYTAPRGAAVVPDLAARNEGEPFVAVATHATAAVLRAVLRVGAVLFVDESDPALAEVSCVVTARAEVPQGDAHAGDGSTLGDARAWSRGLREARVGGEGPDAKAYTDAPRVLAGVFLDALDAHAREHGHAALYRIPDARAWCLDALARALARRGTRRRAALAPLHPHGAAQGNAATARELAGYAFAWWERWEGYRARRDRRVVRDEFSRASFQRAPSPLRGVESFAAFHRWTTGATFALPMYPRGATRGEDLAELAPVGTILALRSPSADACADLLTPREGSGTRGVVVCLDATGDPATTERAVRGPVDHHPIATPDAADVSRVLLHTGKGSRAALCPGGRVRWDLVRDWLAAARAALRQRGVTVPPDPDAAPVVAFTFQPIATALRALVRVEALPGAEGAEGAEDLARAESIPATVRDLVRELAAEGWRFRHFQGVDGRGSNAWSHARAVVTIGDPRPSADAMRVRELYARSYAAALDAGEPVTLDLCAEDLRAIAPAAESHACRAASAELAQCHGRARATQRRGSRIVLVHVGAIAPLDWYQREPGAVRVVAASVLSRAAALPNVARAEGPAAPVPSEHFALAAPHERAPEQLRARAAEGWTPTQIAHAMGEETRTVVAWWEGRASRTGHARTRLTLARIAALDALGGEGEGRVRAWFRAMLEGRGLRRVEGEARKLLRGVGVTLDARSFARWVEGTRGASLRAEVLAALAQLLPALARILPPVHPPPGKPPANMHPVATGERAAPGPVRAAVVPVLVRDPATGEQRRAWTSAEDLARGLRFPRPLTPRELARPVEAAPAPEPAHPGAAAAAARIARALDTPHEAPSRVEAGPARLLRPVSAGASSRTAPRARRDVAAGAERDGPPDDA